MNLHPALHVPDPQAAQRAERAIRTWEQLRLATYQRRDGNADRIACQDFGGTWACRFPAVGYFNQVLGLRVEDLPARPALESFLAGAPAPPRWSVAADTDRAACFEALAAAGYAPVGASVRVGRSLSALPAPDPVAGAELVPCTAGEAATFARLYLEVFDAQPPDRDRAIANLSLLPSLPGLHGWMVRLDGAWVGLGLVHVVGETAFLCAGGVRAAWRERGLQAWLIRERLHLAAAHGATEAVSWAETGGVSHRNLSRAGLREVCHQPAWARSPEVRR